MQSITSPHCSEYIVMSGDWRRLCILVFVIVILNSLLVLLSDVEIRTAISGLWIENLKMLHICTRDKASQDLNPTQKEVYSLDSTFLLWSIFLVYPALEDMTETILTYKRFSKTNFTTISTLTKGKYYLVGIFPTWAAMVRHCIIATYQRPSGANCWLYVREVSWACRAEERIVTNASLIIVVIERIWAQSLDINFPCLRCSCDLLAASEPATKWPDG